MTILILNLGSTSFKHALYGASDLRLLQKGNYEIKTDAVHDVQSEVDKHFRELLREIGGVEHISAVGHRVVHGGDKYFATTEITAENLKDLEECNNLAPLHNPYNLAGVKASLKYLNDVKNYAVFDTAFFSELPESAKIYSIPEEYYEQGIHRFGFHGTSHKFVAQQACQKLKLNFNKLNLITVHLGGGCSVTAIQNGKPIETSMGWTPLEGLMMQTRSGDIDVAAVFYIMKKEKLSVSEMDRILNKESGLLGVSGISNDFRLIQKAMVRGSKSAKLAYEVFVHRIKKYIGAYLFILGGADAICLTGGIGENSQRVIDGLRRDVSKFLRKKTKVLVIPTDEELMIAHLALETVKSKLKKRKKK